ncbi:MAG: Tol-Pal system beta propeller repeat protein TolB [Gemmatimonadota bacterium]
MRSSSAGDPRFPRRAPLAGRLALALFGAVLSAAPAAAQQEVRLEFRGYVDQRTNIAVDDLAPLTPAARTVAEILAFDLEYSLRFNVLQGRPQAGLVRQGTAVDYSAWTVFGTEYLVAGSLTPTGAGFRADIGVHHVPLGRQIHSLTFSLPDAGAPGFRAAAHTISNALINELTGEQGIAETKLAFASRRRGDKEIYVVDYDGHNAYRVTSTDTINMTPDWRGGGEICFTTFITGDPDLYCAPSGGGSARPLSNHKGLDMAPSWSPDGRRLAHTLTKDGNAEIYVLDAGARRLRRLTYSLGIDTAPSWSPNGRAIAFESDRGGSAQIFSMDAEGANLRQLTFGGEAHSPAWSPPGDRIAYVERIGGRFQIVTTGADGGGRQVMTSVGDNEDPTWSPDGLHLGFSSTRGGGSDIYTMDWDGANVRRVTRGGGYVSPSWSPRLTRQ